MLAVAQRYCTTRCDHKCDFCRVRSSHPGDADFDNIAKLLHQIHQLRIPYVDFTGGNPLLCSWLPEALGLAERLGLFVSLTISGPMMRKCGNAIFHLPDLLRFSIDGDEDYHNLHGHGFYGDLVSSMETVGGLRRGKQTQLLFTSIPGTNGNIKPEILGSVLNLAREYKVLINVNPLFDSKLSHEEFELLLWFARQADVQMSRGKLRFIAHGGNNTHNPTCKAASSVLTISSNNYLVLPCFHHMTNSISLDKVTLREALASPHYFEAIKWQGRYSFCQGCSIWCYIVPSWVNLAPKRVVAWLHALSWLQSPRDSILRILGKLNPCSPYPSFSPKG